MTTPPFDLLYATQFDPVFEGAVELRGGSLSPDIYTEWDELGGKMPEYKRDESRRLFLEPLTNVVHFIQWLAEQVPAAAPLLSRIKLGYVCNPNHYAFIEPRGDYFIIGIYSGLVDLLTQASFGLFASQDAFPSIGHPEQEVRNHLRHPGSSEAINIREFVARGFKPDAAISVGADFRSPAESHLISDWPRPFDLQRSQAAILVVSYAVEFALLHEMGHLLCGHFGVHPDGRALVDGNASTNESGLPAETRYFLEVDADSMAVQLAAGGGLIVPLPWKTTAYDNQFRDGTHAPPQLPGADLLHPSAGLFDRNTLCYLWALAIDLLLCIFSQEEVPMNQWSSPDHPHPLFRAVNVLQSVLASKVEGDDFSEIVATECPKAFWDVLNAWNSHEIPGAESLVLDTEKFDEFTDSVTRLFSRVASTYASLERSSVRAIGNKVCRKLLKRLP